MGKIISEVLSGYAVMDYYHDYLTNLAQPLRVKLQAMPPDPTLLSSPL